MSFSQRTREELLVQDIKAPTAKIELMAAFKAIGTLQIDFNSVMIEIKTSQIKLTKIGELTNSGYIITIFLILLSIFMVII